MTKQNSVKNRIGALFLIIMNQTVASNFTVSQVRPVLGRGEHVGTRVYHRHDSPLPCLSCLLQTPLLSSTASLLASLMPL